MLEIQTQKIPQTGLSRKSYFIFVLQVFPQKRQMDVKILVWFPWFYHMSGIVVTNNFSNVA